MIKSKIPHEIIERRGKEFGSKLGNIFQETGNGGCVGVMAEEQSCGVNQ